MLSFCLYFCHVVFSSVPLVEGLLLRTVVVQNNFQWYVGLGEFPLWSYMCLFFPFRDTSSPIFISAVGKIYVVNVKTFMLFIPLWRLSPNQYSQRSYESLPSLFLFFYVSLRNQIHKPSHHRWLGVYLAGSM